MHSRAIIFEARPCSICGDQIGTGTVRFSLVIFIATTVPDSCHATLITKESGRKQRNFRCSNSLPKLRDTRNTSAFILQDFKQLTSRLTRDYCSNDWGRSLFGSLTAVKYVMGGPGSSVGIATDYGLDGPVSNPGGEEIFRPSRPDL